MCQHVYVRHTFECQLRSVDADSLSIVNASAYADFLQEARIDLLNRLPAEVREQPSGPVVVVRTKVEFLIPLKFRDGPVSIEVWVERIRAASFSLNYEIFDADSSGRRSVYARAMTVLAPLSGIDGEPRRISVDERASLRHYLDADDSSN